ncbi:MAG: Mut7-C RNAse domain-containing protein [Rudaea sp.]
MLKETNAGREVLAKFVADAMLGRLARWLRVLGYDTLYSAEADDAALARQSRAEDRILLTRDRELAHRKGILVLWIKSDRVEEQLSQVVSQLGLASEDRFSRCIQCNVVLQELARPQAEGRVPPYVWTTQARFRECPQCRRVYWRGTHWARMEQTLQSAGWKPGED